MGEAFTPTPYPSPGECDPPQEGVRPGEGGGFEGGWGPSAPSLLEFLPLSATLGCVDGSLTAERGQGVRPTASPNAKDFFSELPRRDTSSLVAYGVTGTLVSHWMPSARWNEAVAKPGSPGWPSAREAR